jgi:hypothetical protein
MLASAFGPVGRIGPGLVAAVHSAEGTTVDHRPPPIDLLISSQPVEQREVHQIADAGLLPFAQPPARHPRSAPESCGSICHGMPPRRTKAMPVRHARSGTRGRPPFGRGGELGRSRSTRSHNASWKQRGGHTRPRYPHRQVDALTVSAAEVLLCAFGVFEAKRRL